MRRRAAGVAGVAHETQHVAGRDQPAAADVGVAVQVRVIVHLAAGPHHPYHLAAQIVDAHARDHALGGGQHGGAARGEDVDALVPTPVRARRAPGVGQAPGRHALHRHRQKRGRLLPGQPRHVPRGARRFGQSRPGPDRQGGQRGKQQQSSDEA